MWKIQGSRQVLSWQYGRIIICHQQPDFSDGQLITSQTLIQDGSDPTKKTSQANKSMQKACLLLNHFHEKRMNRSSRLYIKGGGMILDLAGFAASIYMRGVKNITHIPTTLLAMVDGTVGGKTAINYRGVKNLIGSVITSPIDVLIYVPYLYTLPRRELLNGMAEIIKMAAVYDRQYFQELSSNRITIHDLFDPDKIKRYQTLVDLVKKSLEIKIQVVLQDINESKEAKWLSFGHTLGHAMQLATGNVYKHGESVSIGMIKACQLAYKKGIIKDYSVIDRLKNTLIKFELPTELPIFYDRNQLVELMMQDKKNFVSGNSSTIQFVLIEQIGKMCPTGTTKIDKGETYDLICEAVSIEYPISGIDQQMNKKFDFPASKDLSQRVLFISALKFLKNMLQVKLDNFLICECTNTMINALQVLGFKISLNSLEKSIQFISYNNHVKRGVIQIGNSGITARLIVPLCCIIQGQWQIQSGERIAKRNNKKILDIYKELFSPEFQYLNQQYCFPMKIKANKIDNQKIKMKFQQHHFSPFITGENAQAQVSPLTIVFSHFIQQIGNPQKIVQKASIKVQRNLNNKIIFKGDILATAKSLQYFEIEMQELEKQNYNEYRVAGRSFDKEANKALIIQPDTTVLSQIYVFSKLLQIKQPCNGLLKNHSQISIFSQIRLLQDHMNKFKDKVSDAQASNQIPSFDLHTYPEAFMAMVLFMVKPLREYQKGEFRFKIEIQNIVSERYKQSNRIDMIIKNLKKIGVKIEQFENKIRVTNGYNQRIFRKQNKVIFQTQADHRLSTLMGLICAFMSKQFPQTKFIIDNKKCIQKSFPGYFNYLSALGFKIRGCQAFKYRKHDFLCQQNKNSPIVFLANVGSGKRQLAIKLAESSNMVLIDLKEQILKRIKKEQGEKINSIRDYVLMFGEESFYDLESQVFQQWMNIDLNQQYVIIVSENIIDRVSNREVLQRESYTVYIQRSLQNLNMGQSQQQFPLQSDWKEKLAVRAKWYQQCATTIINIPNNKTQQPQINFVLNSMKKSLRMGQVQKPGEGFVLCLHEEPCQKNGFYKIIFQNQQLLKEISALQIRIDLLIQPGMSQSALRQKLSKFMIQQRFQQLPVILSVRTKEEFGQMSKKDYPQVINSVRKIPTDFLDIQIVNQPTLTKDFHYNFNKIIWTYHGSEEVNIKKLLSMDYGMKKICLSPFSNENQKLYQKLRSDRAVDICVLFGDKFSRLQNKYQMVLPQTLSEKNKTGIYGIHDMRNLRVLSKLLGKHSHESLNEI